MYFVVFGFVRTIYRTKHSYCLARMTLELYFTKGFNKRNGVKQMSQMICTLCTVGGFYLSVHLGSAGVHVLFADQILVGSVACLFAGELFVQSFDLSLRARLWI